MVALTCKHCLYTWEYGGKGTDTGGLAQYTSCPKCGWKVRITGTKTDTQKGKGKSPAVKGTPLNLSSKHTQQTRRDDGPFPF